VLRAVVSTRSSSPDPVLAVLRPRCSRIRPPGGLDSQSALEALSLPVGPRGTAPHPLPPWTHVALLVKSSPSSNSLRRAYLEWVEEQIENFKETVSRADLLRLADEVVEDLRVNQQGQYQLTELLLCTAVDRRIFRMLGLPGYRHWCGSRFGHEPRDQHPDDPFPMPPRVGETQSLTSI
jgi:hypothetical protein